MAGRPDLIEWYFLEADKLEVEVHAARLLNEAISSAIAAIDHAISVASADRAGVLRRVREPLGVLPPRVFEISRRGNARQLCASVRRYAEGCMIAVGEGLASPAAQELRQVTKWVSDHSRILRESVITDRMAWKMGRRLRADLRARNHQYRGAILRSRTHALRSRAPPTFVAWVSADLS